MAEGRTERLGVKDRTGRRDALAVPVLFPGSVDRAAAAHRLDEFTWEFVSGNACAMDSSCVQRDLPICARARPDVLTQYHRVTEHVSRAVTGKIEAARRRQPGLT